MGPNAEGRRGRLPRLLYTREEAAQILGMSLSHFQRHVQPFIACVYSGQLRLYRPADLGRWAEREAVEPGSTGGQQRRRGSRRGQSRKVTEEPASQR